MKKMSEEEQKQVIAQVQSFVDGLPDQVINVEAFTITDMVAKSESLEIPKADLIQSIAQGTDPYFMLFHSGEATNKKDYFAFQIELYVGKWVLKCGVRDPEGNDFLTVFNDLTVQYEDYDLLTVDSLVESITDTFSYMLSGQIVLLTSTNTTGDIYGSEIVMYSQQSQKTVNTMWYGGKVVSEPASTLLRKNTLLPVDTTFDEDYILNNQKNGKPLFAGRTFEAGKYTPLTYEQYKLYENKKLNGTRKSLSFVYIGSMLLFVAIAATRYAPTDSNWLFIAVGILFIVLMGYAAKKVPFILISGLVPLLVGSAAFAALMGFGTLLYYTIPQLDAAINGDNTALSMTLVLGYTITAFVTGIVVYGKSYKPITAWALKKFPLNL